MKCFVALIILVTFSVHITLAQNVGIGTALPNKAKLEISGAVGNTTAIFVRDSGFAGISFQRTPPAIGFNQYTNGQNYYIGAGTALIEWLNPVNGSLNFDMTRTAGTANQPITTLTRSLTIQQNGNVSISAGEANASLFVGKYVATSPNTGAHPYATRFQGTNYHSVFYEFQGGSVYNTRINGGKPGSDVYVNDVNFGDIYLCKDCFIGINATGPAELYIKQVNGRGLALVEPSTFHNWEFITTKNLTDPASDYYVYYNGQYRGNFFYLDGGYYPISDKRLKKDIHSLNTVLPQIMELNPVSYKSKDDNPENIRTIGFIAQEVNTVLPELTDHLTEKDTKIGYSGLSDLYTLQYDGMAPVIIKAIQEQQEKIDQLQSKNKDLRKRIKEIEKLLNKK
ncbi:MAG: tail fiber domain-containing protein [Bacteroidota bacterium]